MDTNQKGNYLWLIAFIFYVLFASSGFGQVSGTGTVKYLDFIENESNNNSKPNITIYPPKGKGDVITKVIINETTITPGSVIEVPSNTIVKISVPEGDKLIEIRGYLEVEFDVHIIRPTKGKLGRLWAWIKEAFGSLTVYNDDRKVHLSTIKTEFQVSVDDQKTNFELLEGKVSINNRVKIQIEDKELLKLGIFNDSLSDNGFTNRLLYMTETTKFLNNKNKNYPYPTDIKDIQLLTDLEISQFFDEQLKIQKRNLRKKGVSSNVGFKNLEMGFEKPGIQEYEKAIEFGEISRDEFIESSLLLTEAYFRKGNLKQRKVWLDAAIHFSKIEDSINKTKVDYFNGFGKKDTADVFKKDQIQSQEYLAWAYTVKLLINGCLESQEENPRKFIDEAQRIRDEFSNPKN